MCPKSETQNENALKEQAHQASSATGKSSQPPSLLANASLFSRLIFSWPYSLLKTGMERPLREDDLPDILEAESSKYQQNYFERIWEAERKRSPQKPNLHRALLVDYFKSTWKVQPLYLINSSLTIVQAVALGYLIESFENGSNEGYRWAAVLVICGLILLFEHHHAFFITWRKGMQIRISCVGAIYAKSLRLSSTHQGTNANTGKIMNLASNDVDRFLLAALFINYLFWSPLQSIAILAVGWTTLGPAFAAGFALLVVVLLPFQFYLSNQFAFFRSKIAAITDRRVTFVSQAVHGARIMKMSGFEWRFLDRIQDIRKEEVDQIQKANKLKAANEALFFASNVVISLVIFLVHVLIGGVLTPRDIFTVFTLVNILQLGMTKHVSLGVMVRTEIQLFCRAWAGRISTLLLTSLSGCQ
jgi:ATP-binding cassette subfamily C (CFTR/MRP) protein 4